MEIAFEVLRVALNSGLFAALFCFLFVFQLKESREREKKFIKTIDVLLDGLKNVAIVDEKCEHIHKDVALIRADCKDIKALCSDIKKRSSAKGVQERRV